MLTFNPFRVLAVIALSCWLASCAPYRSVTPPTDFYIVTVEPGDTFSSIALRYLKDPAQGWLISEFNRTENLRPGQTVLVPIFPYRMGGVTREGYQVVTVLAYRWEEPSDEDAARKALEGFRRQMALLREEGYHVISLPQLMSFLDFDVLPPLHTVVITFDDPKADFYKTAYPVLRQFGYPAALFVQTERVGTDGRLSWSQLHDLSRNGLNVESRGLARTRLSRTAVGESFDRYLTALEQELVQSRIAIETQIGRTCRFFAYPSGEAKSLVAAFAEKAGYEAAFTLQAEPVPFFADRFRLGRTAVSPTQDAAAFRRQLHVFKRNSAS
ncbi:MAG: polysaccharide deacetylase family protein [Desulfobacterales bacterium]